MLFDLDVQHPAVRPRDPDDRDEEQPVAPLVGPLPANFVLSQHAAGVLRRYLERNQLCEYRVFHCEGLDLEDAERFLDALEEAGASWEPLSFGTAGGDPLAALTHSERGARIWPGGALHLRRHEVVVARWFWADEFDAHRELWLCAAPTAKHYLALRDAVRQRRRERSGRVWQIMTSPYGEPDRLPRQVQTTEDLVLTAELQHRVEIDIVRFFSDEVAGLYCTLQVAPPPGGLLPRPPGHGQKRPVRL